jgi:D-alanyl-D-alanine carboxypeptidase
MKKLRTTLLALSLVSVIAGCSAPQSPQPQPQAKTEPTPKLTQPAQPAPTTQAPTTSTTPAPASKPATTTTTKGQVVANPMEIAVLVNKSFMLPDGFRPSDLVEPNIPFIFTEKDERRLMRKEAATALEQLVAGAKKDGIFLAGVSGFRSYETQASLFNYYVKTQGEETARKYSAEPGHSEHQTGLAMDISGSTGKCAADDCFADTPEANWLAKHAVEYGFIIRYPKGKEQITGYAYEPWHLRYVGKKIAQEITAKGITLEEYYGMHG